MSSFNVITSGRAQVLVDEQQLQALQAEVGRRGEELKRLQSAMETLTSVNTPAHFIAAAMALCNELASRFNAERVGLGFLRGRYVRLMALSHTEKITRNMQLVQDIEAAMEEALDQDVEVIVPPPKEASFVYRAHEMLSTRHGPNAVMSLPLRRTLPGRKNDERLGNVVAVLTVERKIEKPFTLSEIETLRLTCDLFTSRIVDLYEGDRWFGVKIARTIRRGIAWGMMAKHTWAKVVAVLVAAFLVYAIFFDGMFRVEAPFVFEVSEKQVIASPIDSRIKEVHANVGDMVFTPETAKGLDELNSGCVLGPVLRVPHPETTLLVLDTSDIELKLAEARSERDEKLVAAQNLAIEQRESERQVALKQADQAQALVDSYQWQIDRATITAPIDGIILSGDLRTKINAPVKVGDELYQVGGPDKLRAELSVPEDQISELHVGQKGILKATSYPDRPVHFTVERITPVATVIGQKNVFKVRAAIDPADLHVWMHPGMEGLAKVDVRPHKQIWIWTHRMVNWVRMKLWM